MARKQNSLSKTFVWIILALLFVGLAGFGATNLSGTIRTVGFVGDKPISVTSYARAIQNEMNALQAQTGQTLSFATAQAFGLDRQVMAQLVTARALDHETDQLGLSIGDENLRQQLLEVDAFKGIDGKFDREAYRFALQNANLDEAEFEEQLREDATRAMLQGAVLAGNTLPDAFADAMISYIGEQRGFTWARITADTLETEITTPDDAALTAYYAANAETYTLPETKRITYAWLTPTMILDTVEVDEAALRDEYAKRDAEFNQPERRLVERLPFADQESANSAKAQLEVGSGSFDSLVTDRGLELSDVDMGDVAQDELGTAGEAVFAAAVGDVVGPFATDLGPALFRVNAILAAQATSFEDAQETLRDELAMDRASRVIASQAEGIDDLLAGGATLEELVQETEMVLAQGDWYDDVDEGIAAYDDFRAAAQALTVDDFPKVIELEDGGIYAMRLDEVIAPRPEPLKDIRDRVAADWTQAETLKAQEELAKSAAAKLDNGDFAAAGLEPIVQEPMLRSDFNEDLPAPALRAVFEMDAGEVRTLTDGDVAIVLQLTEIVPADAENDELAQLRSSIAEQSAASVGQDLFQAFANDIQQRAGISIDQQALNAVHANFQ